MEVRRTAFVMLMEPCNGHDPHGEPRYPRIAYLRGEAASVGNPRSLVELSVRFAKLLRGSSVTPAMNTS